MGSVDPNDKRAPAAVLRELQPLGDACHWTSGAWGDGVRGMQWNELQSVHSHVQLLSSFLIQNYLQAREGGSVKFFLPDALDLVDPGFDFDRETWSEDRVRQRDDLYIHEVFKTPACDAVACLQRHRRWLRECWQSVHYRATAPPPPQRRPRLLSPAERSRSADAHGGLRGVHLRERDGPALTPSMRLSSSTRVAGSTGACPSTM